MSALARPHNFNWAFRPLTEFEALQEISRQTSRASSFQASGRALLESALRVRGIRQIVLTPSAAWPDLPLMWGADPVADAHGAAVAEIAADARVWGEVRVRFDLRTNSFESPLRFARFIGQQLGGLLNRFDLQRRRRSLSAAQEALRRRIATRKLAQRATCLIAETRNISGQDALLLLMKLTRESRRSLSQVAEAIVLSQGDLCTHPKNEKKADRIS